jgi:serine/threonine-protein kinase
VLIRCPHCGAWLEADAKFCGMCASTLEDNNVGRVLASRYILRERIGSGSLGVVYRAEQMGVKRKLAIKLLAADPNRDPRTIERFRREGELLCQLRSPHTVTTYEYSEEPDGSLYIAMELSSGKSLAEVVRDDGPLHWGRVFHILDGLCDSLAEAHALGIVHRDLKPENILLESRPANHAFVKLLDFGLAKLIPIDLQLSPPGQVVGSIEYTSPEQLLRHPLDARSDVYALGVLAFKLMTGRHPLYEARTFGDLVAAHIHTIPLPASLLEPTIPKDVDAILARCLAKEPDRRYPDAAALRATVGVVLSELASENAETIHESR